MKTSLFTALIILLFASIAFGQHQKADAHHRRWICAQVSKAVDLLLYDLPEGHGSTTVCSYTDDWLVIKPKQQLGRDRMTRFVFLAFTAAGFYQNEDFMMPPKVYVGYGNDCKVLDIKDAAFLQQTVKFDGNSGMFNAMAIIKNAPSAPCP